LAATKTPEYELVLMLDPEASDDRREQIVSEARSRIESGGTLKHDTAWGMRKMAFEIRQRTEADYRFFRFESEPPLLRSLDHELKIADGVLRFRIFKVDPRSPLVVPPPPTPGGAPSRGPRRSDSGPAEAAPAEAPAAPAEAPAPADPAAEAPAPAEATAPASPAEAAPSPPAEAPAPADAAPESSAPAEAPAAEPEAAASEPEAPATEAEPAASQPEAAATEPEAPAEEPDAPAPESE
jgi:ribosomal protein S6